ncbi:hypothetical protein PVAG01_10782 [Phlyctema vagabunda]|uniref:F-box domain-containing protein n=1 Tax=Phlyctema vagabunda TaxID=108571 RepID=A0ABR4P3L8_9HELO
MSTASAESTKRPGFGARFANALRSKSSRSRLRKPMPPSSQVADFEKEENLRELSALQAHREKFKDVVIDSQRGERRDEATAIMHTLGHRESFDSFKDLQAQLDERRMPGERLIASLSPTIWRRIVTFLTLVDTANLALSNKAFRALLGSEPWAALNRPENTQDKIKFLVPMDVLLPDHLFCFPCTTYHLRTQRGEERLRPPTVLNPLFKCENAFSKAPQTRLTPGRKLPLGFLQLALRAHRYGPQYGVTADSLSRRWKQDEWSHATRYLIADNHFLLRVVSTCFVTPAMPLVAKRFLLYSREDYSPYFSVCAHWRDGELMNVCKCAMDHIPSPKHLGGPAAIGSKVKGRMMTKPDGHHTIVGLCGNCRPMRRCPECPTEYLVEIKLVEDRTDNSFKRAIVVTRWSDLGDEKSPFSSEWAACNGDLAGYDSFGKIEHRTISGIFESHYTEDHIPGQRLLSLNPKNEKLGEAGHGWY